LTDSDLSAQKFQVKSTGTVSPPVKDPAYELQKFQISGTVVEDNDRVLPGVVVSLDRTPNQDPAIPAPSPGTATSGLKDGKYVFDNLVKGQYELGLQPVTSATNEHTNQVVTYFLVGPGPDPHVELDKSLEVDKATYTAGGTDVPPGFVVARLQDAQTKWEQVVDSLQDALKAIESVKKLAAFGLPIRNLLTEVASTEVAWLKGIKVRVTPDAAPSLLSTLGFRLRDKTATARGALEGLVANLNQLAQQSSQLQAQKSDIDALVQALSRTLDENVTAIEAIIPPLL
jgi:hypothetical protein